MAKVVQHSFRLTEAMIADIDKIAEIIAKPNGLEPTRTDGVRYAAHHVMRTIWPLVGDIGAGPPKSAPEVPEEYLHVHKLYPEGTVAYRVRGDSMRDALIGDGDFVLVKPAPEAENGDTIVVYIEDNGVVVKRYDKVKGVIYSGTGKTKWVHKLKPEDRILGVLVGVIRKV